MEEFGKWLVAGVMGLWALVVSLVSWEGKRQVSRIDQLYDTKANKDSTEKRLEKISAQIDQHIRDDREVHSAIVENLQQTNITLAKIEVKISDDRSGND